MTREEYDDIIDNRFMPFHNREGIELWEHCEEYIQSLEARITELEKSNSITFPFLVMLDNQQLKERFAELEAPKGCQLCRYWTDSSLQHCTYHDIDTTNIYHYCDGCVNYEPRDVK